MARCSRAMPAPHPAIETAGPAREAAAPTDEATAPREAATPARNSPTPPETAAAPLPRDRKARAARIMAILDHYYPEVEIPLDAGDPFQLLVATILSAQCTD